MIWTSLRQVLLRLWQRVSPWMFVTTSVQMLLVRCCTWVASGVPCVARTGEAENAQESPNLINFVLKVPWSQIFCAPTEAIAAACSGDFDAGVCASYKRKRKSDPSWFARIPVAHFCWGRHVHAAAIAVIAATCTLEAVQRTRYYWVSACREQIPLLSYRLAPVLFMWRCTVDSPKYRSVRSRVIKEAIRDGAEPSWALIAKEELQDEVCRPCLRKSLEMEGVANVTVDGGMSGPGPFDWGLLGHATFVNCFAGLCREHSWNARVQDGTGCLKPSLTESERGSRLSLEMMKVKSRKNLGRCSVRRDGQKSEHQEEGLLPEHCQGVRSLFLAVVGVIFHVFRYGNGRKISSFGGQNPYCLVRSIEDLRQAIPLDRSTRWYTHL